MYETPISNVITFLTQLFEAGAQYGTLNTCRSALSLIILNDIGDDCNLKRFFKGIFRLRPPLPRYNTTWDTTLVLNYVANWYPNEGLTIQKNSFKLVTLLALITAHRSQTMSKIRVCNIESQSTKVIIKIPDLIKTSRVGASQPILSIPFFDERPEICPARTLNAYLDLTNPMRADIDNLFISIRKPYRAVGSQTLSRWVKSTLDMCGIDVSVYSAHSTRHAATSAARSLGVSLDRIRKTAGWSANSNTFAKFYSKTVDNYCNDDSFARTLLSKSNN